MGERLPYKQDAGGSIPSPLTIFQIFSFPPIRDKTAYNRVQAGAKTVLPSYLHPC